MFYTIINIIFVVIAFFLILIGLLRKNKNFKILNRLYSKLHYYANKYYKFLIASLFILTIFTSTFKLGTVPYGLHVDEAGMAYDAISISKYGVDRYLNKFPIYLINYGGGQSAMYAYLAAILIKIFGYSVTIIRTPAVILRICIFICSLFIIKNEKDKLKTLTFLFLLSIAPYFIMQSRWGLDCNLLVGFLTIAICLLIQAIIKNTNKLLLLFSGIFFGLSLYTYALSYIIIPMLLLFICIYLLYIRKINFRELMILGMPICILAVPLMLMILVNNGFINEIKGIITIPLLKNYRGTEFSLSNIFKNLYIIKSILSFDEKPMLIYNSIPYFGTIYYFSIPFFIIGFIKCLKDFCILIRKKQFNINIIFIFWFLSVLICQLIIAEPNINRANAIFVPILYFVTIGMVYIVRKNKLLILPILLIFIINFGLFFNYYYYHYRNDNNCFVATHYLDALEYTKKLEKENVYIANELTSQQHIYILLDNNISPYNYKENNIETFYNNKKITYSFGIPKKINKEDVYIIGNNKNLFNKFKNLGFKNEKFGSITVFYQTQKTKN